MEECGRVGPPVLVQAVQVFFGRRGGGGGGEEGREKKVEEGG